MASLEFKYKLLDEKGQEVGFRGTRGEVGEEGLTLGTDVIPIPAIVHVVRRSNRLVLSSRPAAIRSR